MATAEEKVKAVYPRAASKRYTTNGGESYYLVWSDGIECGKRLGEGKTKSAAFVAAAKNLSDQTSPQHASPTYLQNRF